MFRRSWPTLDKPINTKNREKVTNLNVNKLLTHAIIIIIMTIIIIIIIYRAVCACCLFQLTFLLINPKAFDPVVIIPAKKN